MISHGLHIYDIILIQNFNSYNLMKKTFINIKLESGENPEHAYPYCEADEGSIDIYQAIG